MTDTIDFLRNRRSVPPRMLRDPAPSAAQMETLLRIAARVPDHGKLAPWRFIVATGDSRKKLAEKLWAARSSDLQGTDPARLDEERVKLSEAPALVVVVSRAAPHDKIPEWEQVLSAGAVCMNLVTAALAMGLGASWLTGWSAYDPRARAILGVEGDEKVAGIVYLGARDLSPPDRPRPDVAAITTEWA